MTKATKALKDHTYVINNIQNAPIRRNFTKEACIDVVTYCDDRFLLKCLLENLMF